MQKKNFWFFFRQSVATVKTWTLSANSAHCNECHRPFLEIYKLKRKHLCIATLLLLFGAIVGSASGVFSHFSVWTPHHIQSIMYHPCICACITIPFTDSKKKIGGHKVRLSCVEKALLHLQWHLPHPQYLLSLQSHDSLSFAFPSLASPVLSSQFFLFQLSALHNNCVT